MLRQQRQPLGRDARADGDRREPDIRLFFISEIPENEKRRENRALPNGNETDEAARIEKIRRLRLR